MAGIDENIVREFFEINGFFVRQLNKYQVQSRKKRDSEEIDMLAENPSAIRQEPGDLNFSLSSSDLKGIARALIAVRPWHTSVFSVATMKSSKGLFNFLRKSALSGLGAPPDGTSIFKILVIPNLPKNIAEKSKSVEFLKAKGVDGVITYPTMLGEIMDYVKVNNNYSKSDFLQTLRILKNYGFIADTQLDLFKK